MGAVKKPRSTVNSVAQPPRRQIAKCRKPAAGPRQQERARNRMLVEELASSLAKSAAIEEHMLVPFDHEAAPRYEEKKERVESKSPGADEVNPQRSRFSFTGVLTPAKSGPSTASTPSVAAAGFFSPFLSAIRRVANRSEAPIGIAESAENTEARSSDIQQDVSKTRGGGHASSNPSRSLFGKGVSTDTRCELDSREPEVLSSAQCDDQNVFLQSTKPAIDGSEPDVLQAHISIETEGLRKNKTSSAAKRTKEDLATLQQAISVEEAPVVKQVDAKQLGEAAQSMTVVSLRAMLRKANISSSGKKSELVARAAEARLPDLMSQIQRKEANLSRAEQPRTSMQHKMNEGERQIEFEAQVLAEYVQLEKAEAQRKGLQRQFEAAEEARKQQQIEEDEALRRQQEAEERRRLHETEVLRRQQEAEERKRLHEAEVIRRQQEAEAAEEARRIEEVLRRQQEAEELKRRHEAEVLRRQQEAEAAEEARRKQQIEEAEALRRQQEAEEFKRRHEAEVRRRQQEAEAEEARRIEEALRRQQETEQIKRYYEAEMFRKNQQAEDARRIEEAEQSHRKQLVALKERNTKREALESRKKQKAAEEAKKKQQEADEAYRKQKKAEEARAQRATAARAQGKQEQTRAQRSRFEAAPTRAKTQRGPKTQNFESQASAEEPESKLENLHLAGNIKAAEQSKGSVNLKTAERAASRAGANQPEIDNHAMECSAGDRSNLHKGNALARRPGYRGATLEQQKAVKGMPEQNTRIPQPRSGLMRGERHPSEAGATHGIVHYGEQGILNREWNGQEASNANVGISHSTGQDHGQAENPDLHGAVQYPVVSLDAPLYQTGGVTSLRAKSSSSEYEQLSQRSAMLEQQYRELHSQLGQPVTTAITNSAKQDSADNRESDNVQSIESVFYSHEHSKENNNPAANEQASDKPGKKSSDPVSIDLTKETEGQQTRRLDKVQDSVSKRSTRAGSKQSVKPTTNGPAKPKPVTATSALSSRPRTRSQKAK